MSVPTGNGSSSPAEPRVPGGVFTPTFLRIYVRALRTLGVAVPDRLLGPFRRHHGDLAESGKGEILVAC